MGSKPSRPYTTRPTWRCVGSRLGALRPAHAKYAGKWLVYVVCAIASEHTAHVSSPVAGVQFPRLRQREDRDVRRARGRVYRVRDPWCGLQGKETLGRGHRVCSIYSLHCSMCVAAVNQVCNAMS